MSSTKVDERQKDDLWAFETFTHETVVVLSSIDLWRL